MDIHLAGLKWLAIFIRKKGKNHIVIFAPNCLRKAQTAVGFLTELDSGFSDKNIGRFSWINWFGFKKDPGFFWIFDTSKLIEL